MKLETALLDLTSKGYEATIHARDHGMGEQYIVVQDPYHHCRNGSLVLMGHEPTILRSYVETCKFLALRA